MLPIASYQKSYSGIFFLILVMLITCDPISLYFGALEMVTDSACTLPVPGTVSTLAPFSDNGI